MDAEKAAPLTPEQAAALDKVAKLMASRARENLRAFLDLMRRP